MYQHGVWFERLCISIICEVCEVSNSSIVKSDDNRSVPIVGLRVNSLFL